MKLALLGPTYPYRGGISHHTTLLYKHLRQRHTVEFFSFSRQYPSLLFPGKSDRDPSQHPLRVPCNYTLDSINPITWLNTARYILDYQANWLIIPWWVPFWGLPFFSVTKLVHRAGMRVLFLCHNVVPHEDDWIGRKLTHLALSQGQVFVAQSARDEDLLHKFFPHKLTYRTGHPVYDMFATQVPLQHKARNRLGLNPNIPTMLFFGLVRPYKGLRYLLEAMALVRQKLAIHLLIAGEFWEKKSDYVNQIRKLGLETSVTIIDHYIPNEEVPIYFSAADVVVLPYLETSQSGILPLAFGFNKSVIVTQPVASADRNTFIRSELTVQPGNSQALASAIYTFFTDSLDDSSTHSYTLSSWTQLIDTIEAAMSAHDQI